MKEVNEELEGNTPRWDSNLGRWIEPEEVLDNPEPVADNATNETRVVTLPPYIKTRKLARRRKGETLIDWLKRVQINYLNAQDYIGSLWIAQLIRNIKTQTYTTVWTNR